MDSSLLARAEQTTRGDGCFGSLCRPVRVPCRAESSSARGSGSRELKRSDSQRFAATRSGPGPDLAGRGCRSLVIFPVFYSIAPGATARSRMRASRSRLGVLSERKSFCSAFRHGELPTRPGQRVTMPSCTADARLAARSAVQSCTILHG
jgi:hypothetical protein